MVTDVALQFGAAWLVAGLQSFKVDELSAYPVGGKSLAITSEVCGVFQGPEVESGYATGMPATDGVMVDDRICPIESVT
jgi:hypothetical protein